MSKTEAFPIEKFTSKSDSIFKNIPIEVKSELEKHMVEKTAKKGQNLFLEGSFPAGIFYLKEGLVKKYKTDHFGKEHILYLCSNGDLLGYSALLCNEPYPDSAAAIETSKLGFISKEYFLKTLYESQELMINLLSSLSHEFSILTNSITVFAHMTVRERLALILLILMATFKKKTDTEPVEILLSREDLSNMVGAATESVVRLIQEFKKEELIQTMGKKIILLKPKELIMISKFY
ncbi:MAG: Crp/Fnr family transcriptional regulator [Bacteroidales bacterium]